MTWFNEWFRYSAVITLALLLLILPVSAVTSYTWTVGSDTIVVFNGTAGSTAWAPPAGVSNITYLVVGGGGGGAGDILTGVGGGGGGGGGILQGTEVPIVNLGGEPLTVVVGAGGSGGSGRPSVGQTRGGNSSLGNVIAYGGGAGFGYSAGVPPTPVLLNASGGGVAGLQTFASPGTVGQGFSGGTNATMDGGSGGGGAGAIGGSLYTATNIHNGASGGRGNISMITKVATYYAGGGGGGAADTTGAAGGPGGIGGGGTGGATPGTAATAGTANTGGGGGGSANGVGGAGGSGIVILRYKTPVTTELAWSLASGCYTASYNGYRYVKFNATGAGTYTIPSGAYDVNYLVVAGGGSGGAAGTTVGGAGGAGGVRNGTLATTPGTVVTLTVGAGGQAVTSTAAQQIGGYAGGDSVFSTITATGGGKGGAWNNASAQPGTGGSGAGGVYTQAAAAGTAGQGQSGGAPDANPLGYGGGGGGGNTTAGSAGSTTAGGNGGLGGTFTLPGLTSTISLAGGGGGALYPDAAGLLTPYYLGVGSFGGGDGGATGLKPATSGLPETGGGGGGAGGLAGPVTSGAGGSGVIYLSYIPIIPVASFSPNVTTGAVQLPVSFTDESVLNPTAWNWSFTPVQGGNYSDLQNPTYTFMNPGTFSVLLNVTNASGYNTTTRDITVTNPASLPTASFTVNKTLTYLPDGAFEFTDTSTPNVYAWQWNFTTSTNSTPYTFATSQNPVHTFTLPGIYYVTVKATNYLGSTTSAATPLIVNGFDAPRASYTISPTTGTPGALILFNDTSTVPSVAGLVYNWSFGTGSVELNPYSDFQGSVGHVYNYGGVYNINLTVSNYNGTSFNYTVAGVTISTEQRMTNWYSPHQVRFRVLDANDNPIKAAYINATAYESSLPGGFAGAQQVLIEMYGINSISASQMVSSAVQMQGYTGDDGSASFTMHGNLKYLVYVTDLSGNTYTKTFYPQMDQYMIRVTSGGYTIPQNEDNILGTQGNATLTFSEPNTTWCTMGLDYMDITGRTTNIAFTAYLLNNQTVMNYTSMAVTGTEHILLNYTVPNVRGQQWKWYYNATVV